MLRPLEALKLSLKRWRDFEGRSRRSEYWWTQLFFIIGIFCAGTLDAIIIPEDYPADFHILGAYGFVESWVIEVKLFPVTSLFLFLTMIPILSLTVRRLHDIGRTGLLGYLVVIGSYLIPPSNLFMFEGVYLYINLAYIALSLVVLVYCVTGSQEYRNQYGPSHYENIYEAFD